MTDELMRRDVGAPLAVGDEGTFRGEAASAANGVATCAGRIGDAPGRGVMKGRRRWPAGSYDFRPSPQFRRGELPHCTATSLVRQDQRATWPPCPASVNYPLCLAPHGLLPVGRRTRFPYPARRMQFEALRRIDASNQGEGAHTLVLGNGFCTTQE